MAAFFDDGQSVDIKASRPRVIELWEKSSTEGLVKRKVRKLLPVIKLNEIDTYPPWEGCFSPGLVVKFEDLITANGKKTTSVFDKIRRAGGLHDYLNYDGKIVLSSIMPDKAIGGLPLQLHEEIINVVAPDYHITPDGETYLDSKNLSAYEINRMTSWTEYLLDHCQNPKPIGLVKGANLSQIEDHTTRLRSLGIDMFVFHAGDFIFRSTKKSIQQARAFYLLIREMTPWVMVYGVGSEKYLRIFGDADCFATQSHFINAFNGQEIGDSGIVSANGDNVRNLILRNIRAIESIIIKMEAEDSATLSATSQ